MSLGLCLDPDHNAGDVCLCPTGCGGFSLLNRLIMANHERSRTYTAGIDSHHPAHISSLGPTVYCIALLTLEGHWLFCCITDLNLTFERPVEDTKVVTQKKKWPFYVRWQLVDSYQHLWAEYECLWFCGSWVWKHLRLPQMLSHGGRLNFLRASFISPLFSK